MSIGKIDRLEGIVNGMIAESRERITSCVVINERGLIVTGVVLDGSSNVTLAAMVSLISDTALRVSENLGFGNPRTALIRTLGVTLTMSEFLVMNRRFRIGAVLTQKNHRRSLFFRGKMTIEKIEDLLSTATRDIRLVLGGT